jgi:histidinol phosphatase-like enzyme
VKKRTYCLDLDGTICNQRHGKQYSDHRPIYKVIDKINALYDAGHKIIIFTARGSSSGINWRVPTERQLSDWGVKYHQLIFGKPSANYFIDDKGMSIEEFLK